MEPGQNEGAFMLALDDAIHLDEIKPSDESLEQVAPAGDPMTVLSTDMLLQQVASDPVQYFQQVVDEHNQVHYIQLTCDGSDAGNLVHVINANLVDSVGVSSKGLDDASYAFDQNEVGILLQGNTHHMTSDPEFQRVPDNQESGATCLDLNRPITLTEDTVVIIEDEKCVLRLEPGTKSLVAYPIKDESVETKSTLTIKRKRGRPPKSMKISSSSSDNSIASSSKRFLDDKLDNSDEDDKSGIVLSEQESSAAECLLGLAVGQRKSSRVKKKPSQLTGYEIEQQKDDSSGTTSLPDGVMVSVSGVSEAGEGNAPTSVVVPQLTTPNQMQNFLANLGLPVKRGRGRPRRRPLPLNPVMYSQNLLPTLMPKSSLNMTASDSMPTLKETSIIIQQEDGTEKHILVSSAAEPSSLNFASLVPGSKSDSAGFSRASQQSMNGVVSSQSLEGVITSEPLEQVVNLEGEMEGTPAIYQITNVSPSKSDPIRIGPKMSDEELANLHCSKCDFQALYTHQLQQHIAEQHLDENTELFRCKCCNFLSFSKDLSDTHFRDCHPKCICYVCGFTAEHSYIVKRHMQRHDVSGCECSICGKKYKDQYILKMHFKMVHMPAEVLFQCTICSKEFTRKAHLKRHLRIHNPDKPFKCPHCEYRGCERSDINKHLLIHDEPKYTCEICLKTFRHVKNKELHVRRHQGQRDYTCGVCGFLGYTFTDIRKHIERKHMETRHICKQCGATFKSEALLREHRCELILLEQALGASGGEETEEAYTNDDMIQLVSEENRFLLTDPQQIIVSSSPANLNLETLTLPDESLMGNNDPMDHDQVCVEV